MRRVVATLIVVAVASGGCGDAPVVARSELVVTGDGWYNLDALLWIPGLGCLAHATTTTYALDGVPLHQGDCGAFSDTLSESRTFTIDVRHGSETGQMVVADMFPGLAATVVEPPGGRVAPGGRLRVAFPTELAAFGRPEFAWFEYLDDDDPSFLGTVPDLTNLDAGFVEVPAPERPGHFALQIEMALHSTAARPPARIISCTGLAKCTAHAASEIGPMAIEVVAP
jgi:hypothetical protein